MELHLKQWREQQQQQQDENESSEQPSVKIPKLYLETPDAAVGSSSALPLFVSDHHHQDQDQSQGQHLFTNKLSHLSPYPDHSTTKFPRMGSSSYFSLAQWQELELQALIYRYMLAGAAVPSELLLPIKKSLLHSPSPFFLHYSHCQPAALLQSGYWGKAAMDPEPGRCRRTDGKKWRCSRDVVAGHKYCERHMHRGRNRSRKPVEVPTPCSTTTTTSALSDGGAVSCGGGGGSGTLKTTSTVASASPLTGVPNTQHHNFGSSGSFPSVDILHFNQSSLASRNGNKSLFQSHQSEVSNNSNKNNNNSSNRSDGHILRPFFDDWPRSIQDSANAESDLSRISSTTSLSISMPGNSSSDVSLKLSTGNGEELGPRGGEREESQPGWATGWASSHVASMGGPLAEALRSSTSNSSPTSVLHQLPRHSASETSYVST